MHLAETGSTQRGRIKVTANSEKINIMTHCSLFKLQILFLKESPGFDPLYPGTDSIVTCVANLTTFTHLTSKSCGLA